MLRAEHAGHSLAWGEGRRPAGWWEGAGAQGFLRGHSRAWAVQVGLTVAFVTSVITVKSSDPCGEAGKKPDLINYEIHNETSFNAFLLVDSHA